MTWWSNDDDDDDEPEYDESSVRIRPNPKGNKPRTKIRPEYADAVPGRDRR
jgi:ribosome biogenesis GTPase